MALVRLGVLRQLEDTPLFVPGVDNDITSDLTTRVIFEPLARYTEAMTARFTELRGKSGIHGFDRQIWDPRTRSWRVKSLALPTVEGRPLLLVPKAWSRHTLLLNATRLYDTALLTHVQRRRATLGPDGKVLKTPKDRLRREPGLSAGYETIVRVVEQAYRTDDSNIVEEFKRFARERYIASTEEQIARRTSTG